jgi:hypothetical protein
MSAIPKQKLTSNEYLVLERKAENKSEFYDGEMFAMASFPRKRRILRSSLVTKKTNGC